MKGNPVFQAILFILLWGLLAIPVSLLTGEKTSSVEGRVSDKIDARSVREVSTAVRLRFSHEPVSASLSDGVRTWWRGQAGSGRQFEIEGVAYFPSNDVLTLALRLEVLWPKGIGDTAVELVAEPNGFPGRSETIWTRESLNRTIRFSWSREAVR